MLTLTAKDIARFWGKVEKSDGCWIWTGGTAKGYGSFGYGGRKGKKVQAHRVAYILMGGTIPNGLVLDHLCRTPRCVRVDHLEPVPQRVNLLRGPTTLPALEILRTHCPQGHEYSTENTYIWTRGNRLCRTCNRERQRARRARGA